MSPLSDAEDAYGHLVYDCYHGAHSQEVVERDDGYVTVSHGPALYLADYPDWPLCQKQGIRFARGRALDVGCGAGRAALHLQQKGLDAVGIDTIVMYGNNFGLMAGTGWSAERFIEGAGGQYVAVIEKEQG